MPVPTSGGEALDHPGVAGAAVAEAVVEAVGAALPELDHLGGEAVAAPEVGQGELAVREAGGQLGDPPLQGGAVVDHPALGGGGRAELAARGARGEVGLALG